MVVATTLWRAFDKTVRRKPLAFAAGAVYGNSIDLELEVVAKKVVARKALLLIFVDVLLLAFTPVIVRRGAYSFKRRYACTYTREASAAERLRSDGLLFPYRMGKSCRQLTQCGGLPRSGIEADCKTAQSKLFDPLQSGSWEDCPS